MSRSQRGSTVSSLHSRGMQNCYSRYKLRRASRQVGNICLVSQLSSNSLRLQSVVPQVHAIPVCSLLLYTHAMHVCHFSKHALSTSGEHKQPMAVCLPANTHTHTHTHTHTKAHYFLFLMNVQSHVAQHTVSPQTCQQTSVIIATDKCHN